ncbi:MAG: hypothetical protein QM484_10640 [Woeseiaceae bacterium]
MINKNKEINFINDKDVYDGLISSRLKITQDLLHEILIERGVIVSPREDRDELVSYISMLSNDLYDIDFLIAQLEPPSRKEKMTSFDLSVDLSKDEVRKLFKDIQKESQNINDVYSFGSTGKESKVKVNVEHEERDLSRTRLRQRKIVESDIEIEISDNNIRVRGPSNEKTTEITEKFISKVSVYKKIEPVVKAIDISSFDSNERTKFFIKLIDGLEGFSLKDVIKVSVDSKENLKIRSGCVIDETGVDEIEEEQEVLGVLKNAILSGESLLSSPEYQELKKRGFYITKIIWKSSEVKLDGSLVVFEAAIGDIPVGKKFIYNVLGSHNSTKEGYTKTRRPISSDDRDRYISALENAAYKVMDKIMTGKGG